MTLKEAILITLYNWAALGEAGMWCGFSSLRDDVMDLDLSPTPFEIRTAVRELHSEREIVRDFLWNEGKLAGSGYFLRNERGQAISNALEKLKAKSETA